MKKVRWYFLMAWRDSRRDQSRLLLFIAAIVLGIAALVSTLSFGRNLREDVDDQARELLGADLVIRSNRPLSKAVEKLADSLPNKHSEECSFASMVYFVRNGQSRLVQVRAIEGDYPYYGALETTPAAAATGFREKQEALVDKTLLLQYGAHPGDSIRIGELNFAIAGSLDKAPGRNEISMTVAPPVYIPLRYMEPAGVLKKGSRLDYQYYYKYLQGDPEQFAEQIGPRLEAVGLHYETVAMRKNRMTNAFHDLTEFMTLISFIALLLGAVGVASSVNIYIREKVNDIAILRCLGLKARQAFLVYLVQVLVIGLLGSLAGAGLGLVLQQLLPVVFKDILPMETRFRVAWPAFFEGIAVGVTVSLLFALLPLLSVRKISPLLTLRVSLEPVHGRDPLRWLVYTVILCFITWFSYLRMENGRKAVVFTAGLVLTFLVLTGVARLFLLLIRRAFPERWPYLWRQGFANLFRPNNQTVILIVTIGLGTTFIGTLFFVQQFLIDRVTAGVGGGEGNMVLFDIQPDQVKGIEGLAGQYHLPVKQEIPIVTMRIVEVRGERGDSVLGQVAEGGPGRRGADGPAGGRHADSNAVGRWVFENELRVTYRDSLAGAEKLVAGQLGAPVRGPNDPIMISLADDFARRWNIRLGDPVVFDVQGIRIATVVGSLRKVEWQRLQLSFFVVFPSGVLERAPQFDVMLTKVRTPEESARFQRAVVEKFPNVSVIDLQLVLSVLDEVLGKIGDVIRFMAGFCILTGLIVLITSVLISKYQRIRESVLLRTLGATRRQVRIILLLEYFFLGALAAATGILLALVFAKALARWSFEASLRIHWVAAGEIFVAITGLTMLIGLYNSRGVLNRPPLEVLRREE
ncbi:MAG TPA: FtsX-like permease family protein [Puia sp.]|nr:FtsX-like permease family protein [Puia sp.]